MCEGEGKADVLWKLGIAATSCIGGAGKYKAYGNHFDGLENALVLAPDRDKPGLKHTEEIAKHLPQAKWLYAPPNNFFWMNLPPSKGLDIADWIRDGATKEQILAAIGERMEFGEDKIITDYQQARQRNKWKSPQSWNGELGWWVEDDEKGTRNFIPRANFDFEIERELRDSEGGGLVLQFKRLIDQEQSRIILRSVEYSSVKEFVNSLKKAYGAGIICNLRLEEIGALIHTKLAAYRDRGGQIFTLADRRGQQENGEWVFNEEFQLTREGDCTNEETSFNVNNPNLGGEDRIPTPQIVPANQEALPNLISSMRKFHGEKGILPAIMMLGAQTMGLHYQEIMKQESRFPLVNAMGTQEAPKL